MKLKPFKRIPALIASGVILLVCLARWLKSDYFEGLERSTYDIRARQAVRFKPNVTSNLGFVFIDEDSLHAVWNGSLGYSYGLLWPRHIYGRLVQELNEQGARAIAFDIILGELRPDHSPVSMADGRTIESDEFFALQMQRASNVIIAVTKEVVPPPLFLTNALAVGDISMEKDADGILRRAQICRTARKWHPAFRQAEREYGVDLVNARILPGQIILTQGKDKEIKVPLDKDGNFDLADFGGAGKARPFTEERLWHMGVVLAAQELKLDLAQANVDLKHGRITLRGPGVERTIPVDAEGYCYIDWCIPPNHPQLTEEPIQSLLLQNHARLDGKTSELANRWHGKLAVVGSSAVLGNNLTDRGATPLHKDTLLVSKHWNVANSIIMGRFVQRSSLPLDLALIALLGILAAILTWEFRALVGLGLVISASIAYIVFAVVLYVQTRYWIPLVFPIFGASLMTVCLMTWRVVFEQAERRRIKSIFGTVVSEKIMNALIESERLSLVGERRQITVMFADVRGFTEFTDASQERVAEFVRERKLTGEAAEACFDEQARETLNTVNLYLGLVADTIIKQDATLDKFIGDCVMAFWGAPVPNSRHAVAAVRAAIETQRAIYALNQQRASENQKLELENMARVSAGLLARPLLPQLLLGSGINTGMATVGLMGSVAKTKNYTVFGREVNLASRLESSSGRGRIFIGEATFEHLLRDDPELAATCLELPPRDLKGFRTAVKAYEVPWRRPGAAPSDTELSKRTTTDSTTFTSFVQRAS